VKRSIGLAALTVLELPPPELVSTAAAAGYDCVGLRLIPVANQTLPPFDERETERRLADTGVRVLDVEVFRLTPETKVDVSNVAQAKRILDAAARDNSALLVDAIHFFRTDNSFEEIKSLPRSRLRYMQLCDATPERPSDMQEIIRQARGDRLFPGEGGLDLKGLLGALPEDLPLSLEIPVATPMPPLERARRALAATKSVLQSSFPS
jgi:sugar phosphate isomerase/epimerase